MEIDDLYITKGIVIVDNEGTADLTATGEEFGINMFLISQARGHELNENQVKRILKITGMGEVKNNKIAPTQKLYDWTWYLIQNNKFTKEMGEVLEKIKNN